ncbi:flagellar basal-body MS-ring/collar protein FliF [Temperatibacter marinus]|uniref:Flagellar M-ring protein n=1 Tax=Temperatibacter marinus TaxID=1456591 RepID=A0AA52H9P3_9PROT|nr:flagellar basal-body MS-ring/collar protein FliF [Temperatibacter marinus]WND02737.1 flagellar basal-body MS-ring/collar protein FliF [Temperatibacter marinus]
MDGIIQFFKNLGTVRLMVFGVVGVIVVFLFSAIIGNVAKGPMEVLYTNLDQDSSNRIITTLQARNIDYSAEGGGTIQVPSSIARTLRMELAEQGMSGTVPGYKELFDSEAGTFGKTSFELNLNKKRALEGELAKTFKALKGVSNARVHVVLPERRAFGSTQEATASVVITPARGGVSLSEAQAMQSIAASSIPGLSPDRVTVVETSGRRLTDGSGQDRMGNASNIEDIRRTKEALFRDRIETQLERVVGLGRVQANVTLEMTTSRVTENATVYDPDGQVVIGQQTTEEESNDLNPEGGQATVGNTQPGTTGAGAGSGNSSTKTSEQTNFQNSVTKRTTVREPGEITKMFVSVLVDYERPIDPNTRQLLAPIERDTTAMDRIRNLVIASIPIEIDTQNAANSRDRLQVEQMLFAEEPEIEEDVEPLEVLGFSKEDLMPLVSTLVWGLLAILSLLLVVRPLIGKLIEAIPDKVQQPDPDQIENKATMSSPILITADGQPISQEVIAAAAEGDEEATQQVLEARQTGQIVEENMGIEAKINVAQVEGRIQDSALKKVSEIIATSPVESAAIIRSWLYED